MAELENMKVTKQGAGVAPPLKGTGTVLSWLMPVLAIILCAGGGFAVGRLFGTRGSTQNVTAQEQAETASETPQQTTGDPLTGQSWFYDMESVIANLNEPGGTRYVRVGLTLELDSGLKEKDGIVLLEKKMPLLKNWLTLYMANQTVEGIRGETNLRQVQNQISEAFNTGLFGNSQPCIKQVLFKELSIQ